MGHASQLAMPSSLEKVPTKQSTHSWVPAAPSTLPAVQMTQRSDILFGCTHPYGQSMQSVLFITSAKYPARQFLQVSELSSVAYIPTAQERHLLPCLAFW
jgi:hypothetical protein